MLTRPSFKKSLIVEQFQVNYLKLDVLSASDDPIKKCCYLSGALMFSLKIAFDRVLQIIGRLSFRATNANISENAVQDGTDSF